MSTNIKLIDKDALLAEIKRLRKRARDLYGCSQFDDAYEKVLETIDTLEVKEVDLEKEYEDFVVDDPILGNFITNDSVGMILAKHFFELGLKTKGEKV